MNLSWLTIGLVHRHFKNLQQIVSQFCIVINNELSCFCHFIIYSHNESITFPLSAHALANIGLYRYSSCKQYCTYKNKYWTTVYKRDTKQCFLQIFDKGISRLLHKTGIPVNSKFNFHNQGVQVLSKQKITKLKSCCLKIARIGIDSRWKKRCFFFKHTFIFFYRKILWAWYIWCLNVQ